MANEIVSFQFSILEGSAGGTPVYIEIHTVFTNDFGLANLEIGNGNVVSGVFADIEWGLHNHFLKVEMDESGGSTYQYMGTSQLLSVPYALYSATSGDAGATEIDELSDGRTPGVSTYLGEMAGISDLNTGTDGRNVGIGYKSLNGNTVGEFNTASGFFSLVWNNGGNYNTAFGYRPLANNNNGNYNVAVGAYADSYNIDGNYNTILGGSAGRYGAGHTKSGSVFIGYQAGYFENTSNKLYIENSNSDTPLIYGDFENDTLRINGTLDVNNAYQFPTSDGSSGQVLSTNGSGIVTWVSGGTGGGANQIDDLIDGKTGGYSVFLGSGAGYNDDGTSNRNVGVGNDALGSNINGAFNTAYGYRALTENISGNSNVAMGYRALQNNTDGDYNIVLGGYADSYNQQGSNNTIIGYSAGRGGNTYHSKSGNIFIGYRAGYNELSSNKLYIENSDSDYPLVYGDFNTNLLRIHGTLDINDNYQFPTSDGSSGQVLTTNGNGTVGWATVGSGGGATQINDLVDAKTDIYSIFLGSGAGFFDDGSNGNVAVGIDAQKLSVDGAYNTSIGYKSLYANTGTHNTANGYKSLWNNTTGGNNTAFGSTSGYSNTTGGWNTAIGGDANANN